MGLSLKEIRRNCEDARRAFERARKHKFAIGAFNLDNQETMIAVLRAAQKMNSPVLVELSHGEVVAMGMENVRDMVDNYKSEYGVEVYINLDHSPSVNAAIEAIEAGYECIHIDISQSNHDASEEDIIAATRIVAGAAKLTGALVESEPHYFSGSSNVHTEKIDYDLVRKTFSTPQGSYDFVNKTGIDTLAVAIGNLHGLYPVPKVLDIELLKRLRMATDCYFSLHGGSGTPGHYFVEAIKIGVQKININSDMRRAYRNTLERTLKENPTEYAVVKLMEEVIDEVQKVVVSKIELFNSAGKSEVRR